MEQAKKDSEARQAANKKKAKQSISITDLINLGADGKAMPRQFQNRLNEFNTNMLEENRMLNSKINAVRLNMEHQSVIAKRLLSEFKQS